MLYMITVMITDISCLSGCLFLTETFDQSWKSGVLLLFIIPLNIPHSHPTTIVLKGALPQVWLPLEMKIINLLSSVS